MNYHRQRRLRRIKTAITVFFVVGMLLRAGASLFGQDLPMPNEGQTAQTADGEGAEGAADATPPSPDGIVRSADELPTVDAIMQHLNDLYRAESSYSRLSMHIVTENWERTLEMESWSRGEDLGVVVIREPAREAGTATLKTDEGLWNYAPRADRLMRVPSGMMSEGWMGSHFTNEDIMRESDYVDDYETTLSWGEPLADGTRTIVATSVPLPSAAVVYSRVEYTMRADAWTPLSTEFYDGDELVRSFRYSDVREIDGMPIPMRMDITPHYAPDESTSVVYEELEFDVDVGDDLFTQRGLRRVAQGR